MNKATKESARATGEFREDFARAVTENEGGKFRREREKQERG